MESARRAATEKPVDASGLEIQAFEKTERQVCSNSKIYKKLKLSGYGLGLRHYARNPWRRTRYKIRKILQGNENFLVKYKIF